MSLQPLVTLHLSSHAHSSLSKTAPLDLDSGCKAVNNEALY
nr:hypothetical protein [Vibrio mimicus]